MQADRQRKGCNAEIPKEDQDDEQIFDLTKSTSIAQRELLRSIFQAALHLNASDVHFKMDEDEFYVDYRVDAMSGIISSIKVSRRLPNALRPIIDSLLLLTLSGKRLSMESKCQGSTDDFR